MKRLGLIVLLLASCARAPLEDPAKAFRLAGEIPALEDSYSTESLKDVLGKTLKAFEKKENIPDRYTFGERVIEREDYRRALEALLPETGSFERFHAFIRENFDFYEVYGNEEGWGHVFSTGYYDPVVKGSRKKTEVFSRPVYRLPPDLVTIDLAAYAEAFPELEAVQKIKTEQKAGSPSWRGRYVAESRTVVPYFPRAEIDGKNALEGRSLEIVWMDPVDAFFMEIQGSGLVELTDGKKIRLGYDGQNGYPYVAIGKFLTHIIPIEEMSMQRIRSALNAMSREERDQVLFQNKSLVFFKELPGLSLTYSGAEVTPARTIATDRFLFPKGTLNFLDIELPSFSDEGSQEPSGWERKPRWVMDQDTGGAIRGGGRVDLYMGQGPEAERTAGVMKRGGKLWTLAPKESFLERLRAVAVK